MELNQRVYLRIAAAYVNALQHDGQLDLDAMSESDWERLYLDGKAKGLKVHRYKRYELLPRVSKVLGILAGLQPENLLDIGTGRGVFLCPLLERYPTLPVTCLDLLEHRARDLKSLRKGGITQLSAELGDLTKAPFDDQAFDVITALEVLEHIPDTEAAISELVRMARRYIVFSVPSKPDNNPEHIHLFTQDRFRELFAAHGIEKVKFDYVLNHMIGVVKLT